MAAVPAHSLRVSDIKDPNALFERYSTEEIRAIERKVRGEIEQKKEELRQMVGERYRDLIDAADTIGEMRQCSESVVRCIQGLDRYCQQLKQTKNPPQNHSKLEFKVEGEWWTWIDYERFQELIQRYEESGGAETFSALDYVAKTPSWALFGGRERGFDPSDTRFQRKNKTKDISGC